MYCHYIYLSFAFVALLHDGQYTATDSSGLCCSQEQSHTLKTRAISAVHRRVLDTKKERQGCFVANS